MEFELEVDEATDDKAAAFARTDLAISLSVNNLVVKSVLGQFVGIYHCSRCLDRSLVPVIVVALMVGHHLNVYFDDELGRTASMSALCPRGEEGLPVPADARIRHLRQEQRQSSDDMNRPVPLLRLDGCSTARS